MKLTSRILTGSDSFKANRAAHLAMLGTVAEAAALAAAGLGARLTLPRCIAPGGRVTLALAEGPDP